MGSLVSHHVNPPKDNLGLSKDPLDLTHPLLLIEPDLPLIESTIPVVGDGFHSLKTKIGGLDIGSPPLKSEKPDPTNPSIFLARSCRNPTTL